LLIIWFDPPKQGEDYYLDSKKELVDCVKNLYWMGLTTSVSGNHSIRFRKGWMWITPSGISRYKMYPKHLVKVHLKTNKVFGNIRPSIELNLHRNIYNKRKDVNAIVHTHSPFTIGVSISSKKFQHVIEEDKIVVGQPVIISNKPSGSKDLAESVSCAFQKNAIRAVVIKNHGVVTVGKDIHQARAVVESLEEWAKILTVSEIFGGAKDYLT
jgi:ribulose-5-phosphate 4-epimerase/fuculose-1-phosphate aldolase